jgi:hypothetical protein
MNPKTLLLSAVASQAFQNDQTGRIQHAGELSNSVQSTLTQLSGHGCFCQKALAGDLSGSGTPLDAYDNACRSYANCLRATKKPGQFNSICDGQSVSAYDTNGFECKNPQAGVASCEKATCTCTRYLILDIETINQSESLTVDASCSVENNGGNNGGSAGASDKTDFCIFRKDGLSKIEKYNPGTNTCGQNGVVDFTANRFMNYYHNPATSQKSICGMGNALESWSDNGVDAQIISIRNIRWLGRNNWDSFAVFLRPTGAAATDNVINVYQHFDDNYNERTGSNIQSVEDIDRAYVEGELINPMAVDNFYARYSKVVRETGSTVILHGNIFNFITTNMLTESMAVPADAMTSMSGLAEMNFYGQNLAAGRPFNDPSMRVEALAFNVYAVSGLQGTRATEVALEYGHDAGFFNTQNPKIVQAGESKRGVSSALSMAADINNQIVGFAPTVAPFWVNLNTVAEYSHKNLGGYSWTFTEFVLTGFFYQMRPENMPVVNLIFDNYDISRWVKEASARGVKIFAQMGGNDEFFDATILESPEHQEIEALENYSQRIYVNDNHYALNERQGGNQATMAEFVGRFAANHFAGKSYPRVNQEVNCDSGSCKITLSYSALSQYNYPVHFPQTSQLVGATTAQGLPELWTAQSAATSYAQFGQADGRDFRFYDAIGFNAVMSGQQVAPQSVFFAPNALTTNNASMNVVRGNIVWEYEIPTPERYSQTVIRVAFACPFNTSLLCEASGSPTVFPRDFPFGADSCWTQGEDFCKNVQMNVR